MNQRYDEHPHPASYYAASANPAPGRPPLQGQIDADVCIIGAGFTGLSSALHLAEAGLRVVVLEQYRVGWGASGRNGGQIVHSYSRDIDVIEARFGKQIAHPLADMMFEGGKIIQHLIRHYQIACDFKPGGAFAAIGQKKYRQLAEQQKRWQRWGHQQLELLSDPVAIRQHLRSDRYTGLLLDHSAGHLHPLNLCLGEAAAIEKLGGQIYENTPVSKIERARRPIVHAAGARVVADVVIVACNAYIANLEPRLRKMAIPCATQMIATEPLGALAEELLPTDLCVEDNNFLLDYFRLSWDKRLLFGGGVSYGASPLSDIEARLRPRMMQVFPVLSKIRIDYGWSGNFSLTLSRLPEVGKLSDNIYYSHGCSGHGVSFTHLIGRLLAEAIGGQEQRFNAFERLPHQPFPGGALFRIPLTALGAGWFNLRDRLGI